MSQAYKLSDKALKELTCCDNQRIMVDESFSYEASITDEGKLFIDTNDYCTLGFENVRCVNRDTSFEHVEKEW